MRFRKIELSGWGNFPRQVCLSARPERLRDLVEIVKAPTASHLLSRGLGRSYGDSALDDRGAVILHERLNRFLSFDPESGVVEAEAGATFEELLRVFVPKGFFPPVTPGTKFVTIGGAVAADVHGKNHHRDGSFGEYVDSITLVLSDGSLVTCSRTERPELFWATVGGMGLTGAIYRVRFRLIPVETAFLNVHYQRSPNLDTTLERLADSDSKFQYSVCWIDCLARGASLGRSVLMRGNHAKRSELPRSFASVPYRAETKKTISVPFFAPGIALNSLSVGLFNQAYYMGHPRDAERVVAYEPYFYPLDRLHHWNRLYGRKGFVQFQAVLPYETSRRGLTLLLEKLSDSRRPSFLAVLKTMGKSSGGLLSFPRPGHTLALDIPNHGPSLMPFLEDLTAVVLNCGGRIYLAKDAVLSREAFREMYPSADRFLEVKRSVDPGDRFQSSQARRLGLVGGKA